MPRPKSLHTVIFFVLAAIFAAGSIIVLVCSNRAVEQYAVHPPEIGVTVDQLYDRLDLGDVVSRKAFKLAAEGYERVEGRSKDILAVVDYSKPSTLPRMSVIDMAAGKVLFSTHVAHGRQSGENYATQFSNENGSHKSSLGFFLTGDAYNGKNGYSLLLDGLEKGFNDRARERAIVIHGADYCDPETAERQGRLGRSFGCPALPRHINDKVIDTIKEGAVLFIYADDRDYLTKSSFLSPDSLDEDSSSFLSQTLGTK